MNLALWRLSIVTLEDGVPLVAFSHLDVSWHSDDLTGLVFSSE